MTSLKQQVREALAGVCDRVFYQYPASFGEIPCAAWRESGNREYARADGGEYLAEVVYTVDLFGASTGEMDQIARRVDTALSAIGLSREYAAELYEAGSRLHHRVLRYRGVTDGAGSVYQ